MKYRKK